MNYTKGFYQAFYLAKVQRGVTKVEIREVNTTKGKGWCFDIYWGASYPNLISSAVKTKIGAVRNFIKWAKTGKFSTYGNAE